MVKVPPVVQNAVNPTAEDLSMVENLQLQISLQLVWSSDTSINIKQTWP